MPVTKENLPAYSIQKQIAVPHLALLSKNKPTNAQPNKYLMGKDSTTSNSERSIIEELKRNKLAYEAKLQQYEIIQQKKKRT